MCVRVCACDCGYGHVVWTARRRMLVGADLKELGRWEG